MTEQVLSVACFNAILHGKIKPPVQWDIEGALKLRTALLSLPDNSIPDTVTVNDIYNAVLPMYDFQTTDSESFMPYFQSPSMEELERALADEAKSKGVKNPLTKVHLQKVEGFFDSQGHFTPTALWWSDDLRYEVTLKERREGHSEKVGGIGTRYIVSLGTKNITHERTILQDETGLWYVESMK